MFQGLGSGGYIVEWISGATAPQTSQDGDSINSKEGEDVDSGRGTWNWRSKLGEWFEEGEKRVEKVGKKYGILGYTKVSKADNGTIQPHIGNNEGESISEEAHVLAIQTKGSSAAEKVANAISAYVVVKVSHLISVWHSVGREIDGSQALLPVRIGVSLAAAPAFARFALEPFRRLVIRKPPIPKP